MKILLALVAVVAIWQIGEAADYCKFENRGCVGNCRQTLEGCRAYNIDRKRVKKLPTNELCRKACDENDQCAGYVFQNDSKKCFQKSVNCNLSVDEDRRPPSRGHNYYVKIVGKITCGKPNKAELSKSYCRRPDAQCYGHDVKHMSGLTEEQCIKLCDSLAECVTILHRTDGNCWTKKKRCSFRELTPEVHHHGNRGNDLVKMPPGGNCAVFAPPAAKFCERRYHYCYGSDIHHRHPATPAQCERWCLYHPDCLSYQYKMDRNCWIKRKRCANDKLTPDYASSDFVKVGPNDSCEQYSPTSNYCTRPGKDCKLWFIDIRHAKHVDDQEMCEVMCNYNPECKSFHYRPDIHECWMKKRVCTNAELSNAHIIQGDAQGVDVVKIGPNENCDKYKL